MHAGEPALRRRFFALFLLLSLTHTLSLTVCLCLCLCHSLPTPLPRFLSRSGPLSQCVRVNLRFDGAAARRLGVENHVCEVQLVLRAALDGEVHPSIYHGGHVCECVNACCPVLDGEVCLCALLICAHVCAMFLCLSPRCVCVCLSILPFVRPLVRLFMHLTNHPCTSIYLSCRSCV